MASKFREQEHPEDSNDRGAELDPVRVQAHLDASVFGHNEARRLITQVMREYQSESSRGACQMSGRHVLLAGPAGIGKTTLVREAARACGVPFAKSNILTALNLRSSGNPMRRLVAQLASSVPSATECIDRGVVCIEHLECLNSHGQDQADIRAAQQGLAALLEGEDFTLAIDGRLRHFSTRGMLFVATATVNPANKALVVAGFHPGEGDAHSPETSETVVGTVPGIDLPRFLMDNFESQLTLRGFDDVDLQRFLMDPEFSPLTHLLEEARRKGLRLTVEPGVLHSLTTQARRNQGGIRGLVRLTRRLIRPILQSMSTGSDSTPRSLRLSRFDHEGATLINLADDPDSVQQSFDEPGIHNSEVHVEEPDEPTSSTIESSLLLNCRPPRPESGFLGSHRLATESDLSPYLVPATGDPNASILQDVSPLVEVSKDGAVLQALSPRPFYLPSDVRRTHLLAVGKTGSGKTTKVILPVLASDIRDPDRTVIVIDAQLDLTHRVLALARKYAPGKRIYYLNFKDPNNSLRWNPIEGMTSQQDAFELATSIAECNPRPREGDSQYFRSQAILLQASLIRELNRWMPDRANMSEILRIIESEPEAMSLLASMSDNSFLKVFSKRAIENRNYETVIAELQNYIGLWRDEDVSATTCGTEFCFQGIEDKPSIVVLAMPEQDMARMRPLTNCFMSRLLSFVMDSGARGKGGRLRRPFSLIADEFASAVGQIADLNVRINTLRKRDLSVVAAVQTLGQITEVYGAGAQSLLAGFGSTIFIPPVEMSDAEFASRKGGTMSVIEVPAHLEVDVPALRPTSRPLLTDVEIASPRQGSRGHLPATLFLPGVPPFQAYMPAAYELEDLRIATDPEVLEKTRLPRRRMKPALPATAITLAGSQDRASNTRDIQALERLEEQIGISDSGVAARLWWRSTKATLPAPTLLVIAAELIKRNATLGEFHAAFLAAGTLNIQGVLHFMDYMKLKSKA